MRASKHHPNVIGVQIVQVGDNKKATQNLKDLMLGDVGVSCKILNLHALKLTALSPVGDSEHG